MDPSFISSNSKYQNGTIFEKKSNNFLCFFIVEQLAPIILEPDPNGAFMQSLDKSLPGGLPDFESEVWPPPMPSSPAFGRTSSCSGSNYQNQLPQNLNRFERDLISEFTHHSIRITNFIRKKNKTYASQEEWRVVAMVVDKIFFYIFVAVFTIGTVWIFWQALFTTFFLFD